MGCKYKLTPKAKKEFKDFLEGMAILSILVITALIVVTMTLTIVYLVEGSTNIAIMDFIAIYIGIPAWIVLAIGLLYILIQWLRNSITKC